MNQKPTYRSTERKTKGNSNALHHSISLSMRGKSNEGREDLESTWRKTSKTNKLFDEFIKVLATERANDNFQWAKTLFASGRTNLEAHEFPDASDYSYEYISSVNENIDVEALVTKFKGQLPSGRQLTWCAPFYEECFYHYDIGPVSS